MPSTNGKNGVKTFTKIASVIKDIWFLVLIFMAVLAALLEVRLVPIRSSVGGSVEAVEKVVTEVQKDLKTHIERCDEHHKDVCRDIRDVERDLKDRATKEEVRRDFDNIQKTLESIDTKMNLLIERIP